MTTPVIAPPGVDPNIAPSDWPLARDVRRVLETHYPGWDWGVEIPRGQNVIIVRNLTCNPNGKYGWLIHRDKLGAALSEVERGAGAFLERYRMRRAGFRPEETEGRIMQLEKPEM